MQLTAMKLISNKEQEKTIRYRYDEAGRLAGKQFPGGNCTDYRYNGAGKVEEILHTGADFTERYHYGYDVMGNKITAEKERPGLPEDSGSFSYSYDELNRLIHVSQNGKTLRSYGYDAFGNRSRKTEYQTAGELVTTYRYNTKNQLMQENDAGGTKDYAYDHRGNLLSVTSGEEVLKAYGFDAANQMSSSMGRTDGIIQKAVYQYNGLGHRMGQSIATGDAAPARTIRYTLDLTRQYHNLLQKTGNGPDQTYFWDGNVAGMEEEGRDHFYFQDDLGSPMRLADEAGRSEEAYGFDEFGNNIRTAKDIFQDSLQSFGFTGYQMDSAGGLYFAQARRYDARAGRFTSEDKVRGFVDVPFTLNHYNYCWCNPMIYIDLDGRFALAALVGAGVGAVAGIAAQAISDVMTGQKPSFKNYVSSAIGGAVGGAVTGLAGPVAGGAAGAAASTLVSGIWDMADGTTKVNANNIVGLGVHTLVNAGIGAVMGKVGDIAGDWFIKSMNKAGRGSITQVYKMADTKIHNGTWSFKSLSLKTWGKCIESESYAAFPGVFVSQLENAVQDGVSNIQKTIYNGMEQYDLTSVSSNQTYIKSADMGKE